MSGYRSSTCTCTARCGPEALQSPPLFFSLSIADLRLCFASLWQCSSSLVPLHAGTSPILASLPLSSPALPVSALCVPAAGAPPGVKHRGAGTHNATPDPVHVLVGHRWSWGRELVTPTDARLFNSCGHRSHHVAQLSHTAHRRQNRHTGPAGEGWCVRRSHCPLIRADVRC